MAVTRAYREAIRGLASMKTLDLWYSRVDAEALVAQFQSTASAKRRKLMEKNLAKTRAKDSLRAFSKLTTIVDGEPRIVGDPPLIVPIEDLADGRDIEAFARGVIRGYRRTLQGDRKHLLERFRYVHAARKVVGVGSVGTRAWIILMLGRDNEDPLFLQLKQAEASVLEPFLGKSQYANHGQRVVEGQRLMQAASDIMLGWDRITGPEGVKWDFYMRQLWDNKGSVIIEGMKPRELAAYARDLRPDAGPRARALRGRRHDRRLPRHRATRWTRRWPTSPSSTPTRTNSTTPHSSAAVKTGTRQSANGALAGMTGMSSDAVGASVIRPIRSVWPDAWSGPTMTLAPTNMALPIAPGRAHIARWSVNAMSSTGHPDLSNHDMPRARHLLMLEFGDRKEFDDPKLEYRRLFSELLGTFLLVLVAAGGGILHGKGQISLAAAVVAPGLMVLAIILFMGAVSGAHLNPAVSLAFAVRGDFRWRRVPGYIIVQLLGATLAACSCWRCSGTSSISARPCPDPATTTGRRS